MWPQHLYVMDCENEPDIRGRYRLHCIDDVSFRFHTLSNVDYRRSLGDRLDVRPSDCEPSIDITEASRDNLPYVIYRILNDLEMYIIQSFRRSDFLAVPNVHQSIRDVMIQFYDDVHDYRDLSTILQEDVLDILTRGILHPMGVEFESHHQRSRWNPDGSSEFEFAEKLNGACRLQLASEYYSRSSDRGYALAKEYLSSDFLEDMQEGILSEDDYRRCLIINTVTDSGDPLSAYHLACHYETYMRRNGSFKGVSATKVVDLYKKAASGGVVRANYHIGNIYQYGLGRISTNVSKAVRAYRKCTDDPDALFRLASCYEGAFDHTTLKSLDGKTAADICTMFARSAELGNMYARNRLTLDLRGGVDPMTFTESRLLAYAGDNYAKYALAQCYESGYAGEVSYEKAIQWYQSILSSSEPGVPVFSNPICIAERAPNLYDHDIMYRIGELYELTVLKDYPKALEWFTSSAESGNQRAGRLIDLTDTDGISDQERFRRLMLRSCSGDESILLEIAECYESGRGTKKDPASAKKYYEILAESEHAESQYWLASYLEKNAHTEDEMDTASSWYRRAADNGNEAAVERLDLSDLNNIPENAIFEKCRLFMYSDDPDVQYRLAQCYERGIGVSTSYSLARMHYLKAMDAGSSEAEERLDRSKIEDSTGIDRYRRLMLHSDEPDPEIHHMIGRMYLDGDVIERSESLALDWFDSAVRLGHTDSAVLCGDIIMSGAVKYNMERAVDYYRISADAGDIRSNYRVGGLLTRPGSDPKGYPEAIRRLRLAAHHGDPDAEYSLGRMFEKGLGMPQFYAEAFKWYSLSAEKGHFEAKYRRMLLYAAGRGTRKDVQKASQILSELKSSDPSRLLNRIDRAVRGNDTLSILFKKEFLS